MIKLKSNQLSYKLFLALCILGSGIHVHAIESSTGTSNADGAETINTFVRPKSIEQADGRFCAAAHTSTGDVELTEGMLKEMRDYYKVTAQTVENNEGGHRNQEQSNKEPKEESKE